MNSLGGTRRDFLKTITGAAASARAAAQSRTSATIDWGAVQSPLIFKGDSNTAYRDPTAIYQDGLFRLYYSYVRREEQDKMFWYLAVSRSRNLVDWTPPEILSPKDRNLNFSSPGNIVRHGRDWILCLQTYPTPDEETFGNKSARVWIRRSQDLENWGPPELLMVKGPDIVVERMGRMIDPYLVEDREESGKWWCFFDDDAANMSYSHDLKTWNYVGRIDSGENACVLVDGDEYVLFHSPGNGMGMKRSKDMKVWRDVGGLITLGQQDWPWSQGRITAGFVMDLRERPEIGRYVMFFHGSSVEGLKMHQAHGHASLALAWSDDLVEWSWPGGRR